MSQEQLLEPFADDREPKRRPGVPAENKPPVPTGNTHWVTPEKQQPSGRELKDSGREDFTATFGTGQPPRGLSGVMRRAAYKIPDYRVKRWLLLMIADRVDSFERHFFKSKE